jgi:four helix bundle protein
MSEVGGKSLQSRRPIRSFRDLEVYQRSWALLKPAHMLAATFPDYEKFDLASQIRRAAKSIPANIAEGYAKRRSAKEFRAYLANAMGSATELEIHLEIARELGYISERDFERFAAEYKIIARQLYRLIESWRSLDLRPPTSELQETGDA